MRFCEKLAIQRKKNNLSQEQFADTLGVSRQAVSKWEGGTSYPDMDKIIKMTKILNCTLEDLLDDGTIGKTNKKEKIKLTDQLQQILNEITKTYNMFFSMSIKQKLKCIFEMFCLFILLLIIGGITVTILLEITYNILAFIPNQMVVHAIKKIFESIYTVIAIIFGVIIFIHIFKIRYLDYYITIEDDNTTAKKIEQPLEIKERIIIRDPKHSTTNFINIIGKILMLLIKLLTIWIIMPVIFAFIFFVILASFCICHVNIGLIFSTGFLLFMAISFLCFLLIYLAYNFVFNRKQHMKFILISMISSFLLIGISIGLSVTILLNYKQIDGAKGFNKKISTETINANENTTISFGIDNNEENIEYIIDNSKNDIELKIQTVQGIDYILNRNHNDYYYLYMKEVPLKTIYNIFLNDIKNKQIRNYNSDEFIKIRVTLSQDNYELLQRNRTKITN